MMTATAHHTVQTMRPRGGEKFDRVFLFCPQGHEVASSPSTTRIAARWLSDDYSGESCGTGSCGWEGPARD